MEDIKAYTYKWYEFGCKDATYLTTKEKYTDLSISEKGLLKFHLLTCSGCRKFVKQIKLIEELLKKEPDFKGLTLAKEKKDAINQLLTKN